MLRRKLILILAAVFAGSATVTAASDTLFHIGGDNAVENDEIFNQL